MLFPSFFKRLPYEPSGFVICFVNLNYLKNVKIALGPDGTKLSSWNVNDEIIMKGTDTFHIIKIKWYWNKTFKKGWKKEEGADKKI